MHMELPAPFVEGWTLNKDALYSPEGIRWTPADLQRWHWEKQLLAILKRQQSQPSQYVLEFEPRGERRQVPRNSARRWK